MSNNSFERINIGIFGKRNVGKSSLINALTMQDIAIVSPIPGTTRDPVQKAMEIHSLGPCVIWDTAGLDDPSELGEIAKKKTEKVIERTDIALLVLDPEQGWDRYEEEIVDEFKKRKVPFIAVVNKIDLNGSNSNLRKILKDKGIDFSEVSALKRIGIDELREKVSQRAKEIRSTSRLLDGVVKEDDLVVLVVSIDPETPVGRIKLPQVQAIRECLDSHAFTLVVRDSELKKAISSLSKKPSIVVTDSQLFHKIKNIVPEDIMLTSFSILYARFKGDLKTFVDGIDAVRKLRNGDRVLIAESCTHHPIEDDVATVKIPKILRKTCENIQIEYSRGRDFPDDIEKFRVIIHCGGCMISRREVLSRIGKAKEKGVPVANYGMIFAMDSGILERALEPFKFQLI